MWLELTFTGNGNHKILVNMNNVNVIYAEDRLDNKFSIIEFHGEDDSVHVKETLDEIADMIDKRTPSI